MVLVSGIAGATGSYLLLSWLADDEVRQNAQEMARQAELELDRLLLPPTSLLNLLSNVPDLKTGRLSDWIVRLPAQGSLLRANTMLESVFVGGANGEYLNLREIKSQYDRERFSVDNRVVWLVQAQRTPDMHEDEQLRLGLDDKFKVLSRRTEASAKDYDPRARSWYKEAIGAGHVIRTDPYMFYSSGRKGITLARDMGNGFVVAMDINLESLSPNLKRLAQKWSARFWLLDHDKQLIASDQPEADKDPMASTALNGSALRDSHGGGWIKDATGDSWWLGSARVHVDERDDMELRYAIPSSVILGKAERVRDLLLAITALTLLIMLYVARKSARRFSQPLQEITEQAEAFVKFDFSTRRTIPSRLHEIEIVSDSFDQMRNTIDRFMSFLNQIARETDLEKLLPTLLDIFAKIVKSEGACLYLAEGEGWISKAQDGELDAAPLLAIWLKEASSQPQHLRASTETGQAATCIPLIGHRGQVLGVMLFSRSEPFSDTHEQFALALSGFAALVVESRELLASQKQLFQSFIKLIADAVDAKSPHTGGHCHRVPVLTEWLVELASESDAPGVETFRLDADLREAVHIGAWLHDCGKVATPEYVMDKATKLEALYNRIHEIRMRFEVCKLEAAQAQWQQAYPQGLPAERLALLRQQCEEIDADFSFVAACNHGYSRMTEEATARLHEISLRQWTRTIDDTLGLSLEELSRRSDLISSALPVKERVLFDKQEHMIARPAGQAYEKDNPWGFNMEIPELLYDYGEIKNLTTPRGTLTAEERYKINEHMVLTIKMLESLPFPRHLRMVPEIAGNHHERIDGHGYPRALKAGELSIPARMMAIADVFEALTACDRPYKSGHTLVQALEIMAEMVRNGHLDSNLFALFRTSEVPMRYAKTFLEAWQYQQPAGNS
ncbi:MAG TPA: HD domain-containing phosphohydrolase [Azospira sp.]|nr:HD domain-containing phosphohydrolase [Azospira sp.]